MPLTPGQGGGANDGSTGERVSFTSITIITITNINMVIIISCIMNISGSTAPSRGISLTTILLISFLNNSGWHHLSNTTCLNRDKLSMEIGASCLEL